jgi:hydroxymethylpyrimidine/phosphomethylpyrimidine kinase
MKRRVRGGHEVCAVMTVAGSDSGGGAGIQADLKVFAAVGVHGTSAITCVTAQNPGCVRGVTAISAKRVVQQIETVWEAFAPVAVATSGARLLQPSAVVALQRDLLPLAILATPNLDETQLLTGVTVREPEDLRTAARVLHEQYGCAALIKGGHLDGEEAVDLYWDGEEELLLRARRVRGVSTHGTGCTYSAAIVAHLGLGCELAVAVQRAKEEVTQALAASCRVAGYDVLQPFWRRSLRG